MKKSTVKIILSSTIMLTMLLAIIIVIFKPNAPNNSIEISPPIQSSNLTENDFIISYATEENNVKNNIGTTIFHNTRNVILIESKNYPESASKISNYLNYITYKELYNGDEQDILEFYDNSTEDYSYLGTDTFLYTEFMDDDILSIKITTEGSLGGVGWWLVKGYNFNIKTGDILAFNDLSNNSDELKNKSHDYVVNELKKSDRYEFLYENWENTLYENMFLDGNWYFSNTDNGITFEIEEYSIADGATGAFSITVPFDVINELCK